MAIPIYARKITVVDIGKKASELSISQFPEVESVENKIPPGEKGVSIALKCFPIRILSICDQHPPFVKNSPFLNRYMIRRPIVLNCFSRYLHFLVALGVGAGGL